MLQGGEAKFSARTVSRPFFTRVTEYNWRLFQFGSVSELIGPVLYKKVSGFCNVV
jgi:hypothetical protein